MPLPAALAWVTLLTLVAVLASVSPAAAGSEAPRVEIISPTATAPVVAQAEIVARVTGGPVRRVVFRVDGREVGTRTAPPWRLPFDFGDGLDGHTVEVVAESVDGASVRAAVETPPLVIHDRVESSLRPVYATVTRRGRRMLDLGRSEFRLLDDGREQAIVTFERGDVPFTAVLLLDASHSMRGAPMGAALAGARAFADRMAELDRVSVMLFSDRLLLATPFSGDPAELAAASAGVSPAGGTAILDQLYLAYRRLDARQGRRVIVLLSDGADAQSVLRVRDLEPVARGSDALVYWVRRTQAGTLEERPPIASPGPSARGFESRSGPVPLSPRQTLPLLPTSWRDAAASAREYRAFGELVESTGGRIVAVSDAADVPAAFAEILAELREQYVLGYEPSPRRRDGRWRRVRVKVSRPGARVRTRGGYFDR